MGGKNEWNNKKSELEKMTYLEYIVEMFLIY